MPAGPGPGFTYPPEIDVAGTLCREPSFINTTAECPEWYSYEGSCYSENNTIVPCPEICQTINDTNPCSYLYLPCGNLSYTDCFWVRRFALTQTAFFRAYHLPMALFYFAIIGQLITIASCFSHKRKSAAIDSCCNGRPAMFRVGDLNTSTKNRNLWILLFRKMNLWSTY